MYNSTPGPGEYPRLFFAAADLEELRAKLDHPDCRAAWGRLLAACEEMLGPDPAPLYPRHIRPSHLAFAYLMTGREEFARQAMTMALAIAAQPSFLSERETAQQRCAAGLSSGGAVREVVLAYDWLYDLWAAEQRAQLRQAIADKGFAPFLEDLSYPRPYTEWYTCNGINVVTAPQVMAAILFEEEMDCSEVFEAGLRQLRRAIAAHCPDGGYPEGLLYWNYCVRHMLMAVEPLRRLKGLDLYHEPFLHTTCDYPLHNILPGLTECTNTADATRFTHLWPPIAALAAQHRRPEWQWLAQRLLQHDWQLDGESLEYSLFFLLYYDPTVPAAPPSEEQRTHLFSGLQQLSMRSDWTDRAVHALWLNGPTNCHHNHLHLNSVTISAFGRRLLVEMGKYDYVNEQDYRKQTAGHNSLLVDGQGQIITTDTSIFCRRLRAGHWGTVFGEFRCLRREAGALIATGATVNAYHGRLRTYDRTLAFVGDRFFFLHDHVELEQAPPVELRWHFHSGGEIVLEDNAALITNGPARLLIAPLCELQLDRTVASDHYERDGDHAFPYLVLRADCTGRTADLFALLLPFEEGDRPEFSLEADALGVTFACAGGRWRYHPASRKLEQLDGQASTEPAQRIL